MYDINYLEGPETVPVKVTVSLCMSREFVVNTTAFHKEGDNIVLTGTPKDYLQDVSDSHTMPTKDWTVDELEAVDYEVHEYHS